MQQPLSDPMATTLQRMIADGSLSGSDLQAMLLGPSPVSLSPSRRQTANLEPSALEGIQHP